MDIDFIDPAYALSTPSNSSAACYPTGNTAWVGASLIFELLCPLAEAVAARR